MKISITCENFPTQMNRKMAEELKKQGIETQIQESFTGTLFVTTNVDDVTKAQVFCIIVDKYRLAHGMKGDESDEEAP